MGIVKISELGNDSDRDDLTWETVLLFVWNACEVNTVIVAACIPAFPPVMEALRGRNTVKGSRIGGGGTGWNHEGGKWSDNGGGWSGGGSRFGKTLRGGDEMDLGTTAHARPGLRSSESRDRNRSDSTEEILARGAGSELELERMERGIQVKHQFGVL